MTSHSSEKGWGTWLQCNDRQRKLVWLSTNSSCHWWDPPSPVIGQSGLGFSGYARMLGHMSCSVGFILCFFAVSVGEVAVFSNASLVKCFLQVGSGWCPVIPSMGAAVGAQWFGEGSSLKPLFFRRESELLCPIGSAFRPNQITFYSQNFISSFRSTVIQLKIVLQVCILKTLHLSFCLWQSYIHIGTANLMAHSGNFFHFQMIFPKRKKTNVQY